MSIRYTSVRSAITPSPTPTPSSTPNLTSVDQDDSDGTLVSPPTTSPGGRRPRRRQSNDNSNKQRIGSPSRSSISSKRSSQTQISHHFLTSNPEFLHQTVIDVTETAEAALERILLEGESILAHFECYFPSEQAADPMTLWQIAILCVLTFGLNGGSIIIEINDHIIPLIQCYKSYYI